MRHCLAILFLATLFGTGRAGADVTVRVGIGQATCNYPTIQQAINAANNANGQTIILVTRNQAYNNQQLVINGKNVTLRGGYADCDQASPDELHTAINGSATATRPVINVSGSTNYVLFDHLDISGNVNTSAGAGAGLGGAVGITGGPHVLVGFGDVSVTSNTATAGGAVYVQNTVSSNSSDVKVLIGEDTSFSGNRGVLAGGGVWCSNASVILSFANAAIFANTTGGAGGGIRAENCAMDINSSQSGIGSVAFNTADGNGGGISVVGPRSATRLYTRAAGTPTMLYNNIAGGFGGAIAIESGADVRAWDVIIDNNISRAGGGAIYLYTDSAVEAPASLTLRGDLIGAPVGTGFGRDAVTCAASQRCNRISFNEAREVGGTTRLGSAILADSTAIEDDILNGVSFTLRGTEMFFNNGLNLIDLDGRYSSGSLAGVALFNNTSSGIAIINITAPTVAGEASSSFSMLSTTTAGNTAAGTATIVKNAGVSLEFKRSIHWQPGRVVKSGLGAQINSSIDYVVANDLTGLPANVHNFSADPQFIDAATSDYRLKLASPAVDYASTSNDPTADHRPRQVDLGAVANEFGAQDVGAYERQDSCADGSEKIFCSGFQTP